MRSLGGFGREQVSQLGWTQTKRPRERPRKLSQNAEGSRGPQNEKVTRWHAWACSAARRAVRRQRRQHQLASRPPTLVSRRGLSKRGQIHMSPDIKAGPSTNWRFTGHENVQTNPRRVRESVRELPQRRTNASVALASRPGKYPDAAPGTFAPRLQHAFR